MLLAVMKIPKKTFLKTVNDLCILTYVVGDSGNA